MNHKNNVNTNFISELGTYIIIYKRLSNTEFENLSNERSNQERKNNKDLDNNMPDYDNDDIQTILYKLNNNYSKSDIFPTPDRMGNLNNS